MKKQFSKGFTLIEIILFLAITSLMLMGILASSGSSVSRQRYTDTAYSLQSSIQDLYTETLNTRNTTSTNITCQTDGSVGYGGAGSVPRGQTKCVVLGKYLTSSDDGKTLISYSVVGYQQSSPAAPDDLSVLQSYNMKTLPASIDQESMQWGVAMQKASPVGSPRFTLLILRAPTSGVVRTFVNEINSSAITKDLIVNTTAMQKNLVICLDANDLTNIGGRLGVRVLAGASSASGVEFLSSETKVADGGCA